MITNENLKFCFDNLNEQEINEAFNSEENINKDYLIFELCTFNVGSISRIEATDYHQEDEEETSNSGNLYIDKDQFLQLFEESKSVNPHLIELI